MRGRRLISVYLPHLPCCIYYIYPSKYLPLGRLTILPDLFLHSFAYRIPFETYLAFPFLLTKLMS